MTFRINRKTDYAARVLLFLSQQDPDARVSTKVVQENTLVPDKVLLQIIADLSRAGLIDSRPGPRGGLKLGQPADQVTLRTVVELIEGPIEVSDCIEHPQECPLSIDCPVRTRWGFLQDAILRELRSTTIAQLAVETNPIIDINPQHAVHVLES